MRSKSVVSIPASLVIALSSACATHRAEATPPVTRDRTATGAAAALVAGERDADQILRGAAIGGVAGSGVGAYMDAQEERLARIPGTRVERIERSTLVVRFDSDTLFGTDSARLSPEARRAVDQVAQVLDQFGKTAVVVQGHTDSTGPANHNQHLSERRAQTVGSALVADGVAPQRVVATGYGEALPVASNASERGRRLNRRVAILLKARVR